MSPNDPLEALLAAVARGDRRAFADLYAATSPQLFALLLRMLQRRDWAEEALQDCYVRIWQKSESYAPERGAPLAWLTTIANVAGVDLTEAVVRKYGSGCPGCGQFVCTCSGEGKP